MFITTTDLTVPTGDGGVVSGKTELVIDLAEILRCEVRQDEVAHVTPTKAPELLAMFNRCWRDIHQVVTTLEAEKNKAEKAVNRRKGVLLLEVIPQKLKEMDIKSAVDIREAIINTDAEYERLTDRFDQLRAAILFMKGKLESFENAYSSVKKIMGEDAYNFGGKPNDRLSGDSGGNEAGARPATRAGFGTARIPARR